MVVLEWRLTLLALVVVPAFLIPAKFVGRRLQRITRESFTLNAAMNATMTERFNVSGALLVKLFGRPDQERNEFRDKAGRVRDIGVKSAMYTRTFMVALGLVAACGTAIVYGLGGRFVIQGTFKLGTLVALALYVQRIYPPLIALTTARVDFMTAVVSFERVFEVLDAPRAIDDRPGAHELVRGADGSRPTTCGSATRRRRRCRSHRSRRTRAAALSDEPSDWILKGVSFTAEPGQMVALVGPSGAGKTTLSHLVPRLYDVTTGAMRVDGHDVRDVTLASLAGHHRDGHPGRAPLPRHHRGQPALRPARRHRRSSWSTRAGRRASTT